MKRKKSLVWMTLPLLALMGCQAGTSSVASASSATTSASASVTSAASVSGESAITSLGSFAPSDETTATTSLVDVTAYENVVNALSYDDSAAEPDTYGTLTDTITEAGNYLITGTVTTSYTVTAAVASDVIHLYVKDATWTVSKKALNVTAGTVIITFLGTNVISNTKADTNLIASDADLHVNGSGTTTLTATKSCFKVNGRLVFESGSYDCTSTGGNAISAYTIEAMTAAFRLTATKDGFHAELDDAVTAFSYDAGYVYLKDVTLTTGEIDGDIVQADTYAYLEGGNLSGTTTGSFVEDTTENRTAYGLEADDFRYILKNGKYTKIASDYMGNETKYALAQSCKGIKVGEIEYDSDGDDSDDGAVTSTSYGLVVKGATVDFATTDDALHANSGSTLISGSAITLSTYDDGITTDHDLEVRDSKVTVTSCYEGLEGEHIVLLGDANQIDVIASDDGINASTDYDCTDMYIKIEGGYTHVNASGDGLDSNGYLMFTGGTTYVEGPTGDGDTSLDSNSGIYLDGGTLIAGGSKGMVEIPDAQSKECGLVYYPTATIAANTLVQVLDSSGTVLAGYTFTKGPAAFIFASPFFVKGSTYTIKAGTTSTSVTLTGTITTSGTGSGNTNPGGPGQGGRP
jgi:hypothetical protein